MKGAAASAGVAAANMYPQLTLTADLGRQGLLNNGPSANLWNLVAGISAPLFNGGRLNSQKRAASAAYDAAVASYKLTVLTAFGQVADSLYALSIGADALENQKRALDSANATYQLTWQGYKSGNTGYVQVLVSRRALQQVTLSQLQARQQRYTSSVNLLLAAGGPIEN